VGALAAAQPLIPTQLAIPYISQRPSSRHTRGPPESPCTCSRQHVITERQLQQRHSTSNLIGLDIYNKNINVPVATERTLSLQERRNTCLTQNRGVWGHCPILNPCMKTIDKQSDADTVDPLPRQRYTCTRTCYCNVQLYTLSDSIWQKGVDNYGRIFWRRIMLTAHCCWKECNRLSKPPI